MARQDINTEFNTFVGGILTEANPINYPKGFTLDEENFVLKRNGTRQRRRGLELPDLATTTTIKHIQSGGSFTGEGSFVWKDDTLVVWLGGVVSTFDIDASGTIEASESVIHNSGEAIITVSPFGDFLLVVKFEDRTYIDLTGGSSTTSWRGVNSLTSCSPLPLRIT